MRHSLRTAVASVGSLVFALTTVAFSGPAQAITFEQAASKGTATVGELDELKDFLGTSNAKLKSLMTELKKVQLSNIAVKDGTLTGDARFMGRDWNFLAAVGGQLDTTFAGFGPKQAFKFMEVFGAKPGVGLLDVLTFDEQMFLVAAAGIKLKGHKDPSWRRMPRRPSGGSTRTKMTSPWSFPRA